MFERILVPADGSSTSGKSSKKGQHHGERPAARRMPAVKLLL